MGQHVVDDYGDVYGGRTVTIMQHPHTPPVIGNTDSRNLKCMSALARGYPLMTVLICAVFGPCVA
jgi:hypothetical protein